MPARRPTAWEVSFPQEAALGPLSRPPQLSTGTPDVSQNQKRPLDASIDHDHHTAKRPMAGDAYNRARLNGAHYVPDGDLIPETDFVVMGEGDEGASELQGGDKPTRKLTDFVLFDPTRNNEVVSLGLLNDDDVKDPRVEAVGLISACFENDEDEGQEDDVDVAELNDKHLYVRLGAISRVCVDFTLQDDAISIETRFAWYILKIPSALYQPYYCNFYLPVRVTQILIASVKSLPSQTYNDFLLSFVGAVDDIIGRPFEENDVLLAAPRAQAALLELDDGRGMFNCSVFQHIFKDRPLPTQTRQHAPQRRAGILRNLDLAVLRPENQNPTHVTPLIASLAVGLFRERLTVVGPPPIPPNDILLKQQEKSLQLWLRRLIAKRQKPAVIINPGRTRNRVRQGSRFLNSIIIDDAVYKPGDVIITFNEDFDNATTPVASSNGYRSIGDYFWFAKIIWLCSDTEKAHVQWFEHSSKTHLGEISDPQELFLTEICNIIDLRTVVSKVTVVHQLSNSPSDLVKHGQFFYKLVYDRLLGTFRQVDNAREQLAMSCGPPDNCPVCILQDRSTSEPLKLPTGFAQHGIRYHIRDFVLIHGGDGPCRIGQIDWVEYNDEHTTIKVRLLGRTVDIHGQLPPGEVKDERHLFMTDVFALVDVRELLQVCHVRAYSAVSHDLLGWIAASPDHFYVKYFFPSLEVKSWSRKQPLGPLKVCAGCCSEKMEEMETMKRFSLTMEKRPLRGLDLCAGSGAFGKAMEESGCVRFKYAVEISPSAAKTLRENFPDMVVYNQDVNVVLRWVIKASLGHRIDTPMGIDEMPLPPPFNPKEIDIVIAGFPCQPHSTLNMFRKADDRKSNLILTILSFIDFVRPKFVMFENVRGFLRYNLNAVQAGIHRVRGGIEMGGLKLVEATLIKMNYQLSAGLLQAGHYGTPQGRVRFFLTASQTGYPLPELPQPTHDFPVVDSLDMLFPNGQRIKSVRTARGTGMHPFVTIDDAIGDLPRFDWKNPKRESSASRRREADERTGNIPVLECNNSYATCGFKGPNVQYHHEPRNRYQVHCRNKPTTDLQQFTRTFLPAKVERMLHIPMEKGADYRSLQPRLYEPFFSNPSSATAKAGFKPGFYGRLDADSWFPTTVTNMDPTAKQSRVLHPYCKRMVTVRELARSQGFPDHYVFHTINNNVVTMHRQIGNAVPWPIGAALGRSLKDAMYRKWLADQEDAIIVD